LEFENQGTFWALDFLSVMFLGNVQLNPTFGIWTNMKKHGWISGGEKNASGIVLIRTPSGKKNLHANYEIRTTATSIHGSDLPASWSASLPCPIRPHTAPV
jgi:hypothetical protein